VCPWVSGFYESGRRANRRRYRQRLLAVVLLPRQQVPPPAWRQGDLHLARALIENGSDEDRGSEEELGVDVRRGGARGVEPPVADGRGAHRGRLIHHLAAVICEGREDSAGAGEVGSGLG